MLARSKLNSIESKISKTQKNQKKMKTLIQEFKKLAMVKQWYYQSMLYVVVENQNLLKN